MKDCTELAGPRKASARALRASSQTRSSGRLVLLGVPRSTDTNPPADVVLNHSVQKTADDKHQPTHLAAPPQHIEPAARDDFNSMQSWPPHRETHGLMSIRKELDSTKSVDALVSVHRNTLTIHIQSSPGGAFDMEMASIPMQHLVVTLQPGQFNLLVLSCLTDDEGEIFCCCKDQTARNKWVYVFRRVAGVKVRPLPRLALRPLAS